MTDFEYGEAVGEDHTSRGAVVVSLVNWLGALISVALIAGLAMWGYKLWVRDVTGVPVVRALEGPMRIAPEDPGGLAAEHQGLAVNNIAAEGEAAAPADRLVLAPRPVNLADEDQSAGELAAEEQAVVAAEMVAAAEAEAANAIDLAIAEALGSTAEAGEPMVQGAETLVTASVEVTEDIVEPEADAEPEPEVMTELTPEGVVPASVAGLARSLRPLAKPVNFVPAASEAGAPEATASTDGLQVIDPTTIPVGTRLAQLGAFDSVAVAEAEWTTLAEQFEDVMGGKGRVIQEAQSGGKTFYRLRVAGFEDINDARRFCSVLLAAGASCIPVITR
ncbi:MAG: SPOR domain-containing protein [Paracoccaceae bacterium]